MADLQQPGAEVPSRQSSQLFVRRSTGLVREASALDATIFNAVFSAPVGATLAWGVFFALTAFPGSDLVAAVLWSFVLNIPILIMMSLLASAMPKTGGDYVWVSRILSPPAALVSNFGAAFSAVIGATFWARYFPVFALGPVLVTLGTIFHSHALITAGTHIEADKGWIFLGGLVMILWMTAILIAGTKTTFRWQNTFWFIASGGTLIAFIVLLFASKSGFQHHFNAISHKFGATGDVFHKVITDAHAQNIHPHAFGSATTPAIFVIMTFMIWNWWSVYLSGELKSASNRNRQMGIMFGALSWNTIGLVVGVLLLYKVTGYQFIVGANTVPNAAYVLPTGPFYHFFAGLAVNSNVLTTIIVASFLFWSLPAMVGNTFMPIRSVFAWSFDRVLPERFSSVNERFHSPVPAILLVMALVTAMLAWSVTATTFQTLLALGVLAGVVCVVIVGVAAFAFPIRRAELYRSSPANVKFMGIPVLQIVAPLSIAVVAFLTWEAWHYPALALSGNTGNRWQIPAFMGGIVVVGLLIYYIARAVRKSQGIDLDLVYKELPLTDVITPRRLQGTVALITGGTSGIGLAIASRFLAEGAQVAVTGRDGTRGSAVQDELGPQALFVRADASDPEQVERSIADTLERFGKIDTLVNNAGVALEERLVDTPVDAFDALIAANVKGPYLYARGCFPALAQTRGSMVHIGSDAGLRAEQPIGAYCVSKAAVTMMSQVLALDGAAHGVRSNCVCPGATEPGMLHIGPAHDPDRGDDSSQWSPAPLGRIGSGRDVAAAVAYLASPEAAFVSGAVLLIDGANGAGLFA